MVVERWTPNPEVCVNVTHLYVGSNPTGGISGLNIVFVLGRRRDNFLFLEIP